MNELILITEEHLSDVIHNVVSQCLQEHYNNVNEVCDDVYYNREELCNLLHITYPTLWRMEQNGKIKKIKNGRKNLYRKKDIDELLQYGHLKQIRAK